MNLHDLLLKKASQEAIAHFYIVETPAPANTAHDKLLKFVHQFIQEYYHKVEGQPQSFTKLTDHPDVFFIGNTDAEIDDKSNGLFKVEEAETLNRFFEFKPVMSKRKFAVITEGHRITSVVANKWLKLFEEPQGQSTIFLLNPRRSKLLPTIHSRGIHLLLPSKSDPLEFSDWNELMGDLGKMTLSRFLEKYSSAEKQLSFWVNELIRWESEQLDTMLSKEALAAWLKNYSEMESFHQPTATKWSLFYSYLQKSVLPRLETWNH